MRRQIIWQSWSHPLGQGKEYSDAAAQPPKKKRRSHDYDDFEGDDEEYRSARVFYATAAGLVPARPYGDFRREINLWVGHTSFPIDEGVLAAIEETPGVELLDLLTRYRFRIGFGHAFASADVKAAIQSRLDAAPPGDGLDDETRAAVEAAKAALGDTWAIYVAPNGRIDASAGQGKLEAYRAALLLAGGLIFTSDDR
jgi:hypothetical protein